MPSKSVRDLPVVDATLLPAEVRALLRPCDMVRDRHGAEHPLPHWFYEVDSWETALETAVAPNFLLWEFMTIDVREAEWFRHRFPRYIPCAITSLAAALQVVRNTVGTYVHIAANGGYRSPAHQLSRNASRHCWGSAVNIYRVGDDWLDSRDTIARYAAIARGALPAAWIRPYGEGEGLADDHLHVDLGYVTVRPTDEAPDSASGNETGAAA
ncbi:MAG: hypothetical protein ACREKM_00680 [Longimicrobiales bacterium]